MGAGVLPTAIHENKIYFLFGRENKYNDTPGFADFGGGNEKNETHLETAIREGTEELTGFLGSSADLKKMLKKHGTYIVDYSNYRVHIFPYQYDEKLPYYYNNNQRFLQIKLKPTIIKNSRIFEKSEIRWVCIDDLMKMRKHFRSYYQNIVDILYKEKPQIESFLKKTNYKRSKTRVRGKNSNDKTKNKKTKKMKTY